MHACMQAGGQASALSVSHGRHLGTLASRDGPVKGECVAGSVTALTAREAAGALAVGIALPDAGLLVGERRVIASDQLGAGHVLNPGPLIDEHGEKA